MQRKGDKLSVEKRDSIIKDIIYFFEKEHDMKMGVLAAGEILNFFLQTAGTEVYNKGILDAKKAVESRMDELRYDLDDLLDIP
ncbi:MAG: DUF2164 domain-containing protein [Flavobacteriales bacterium]|nr:DUF2164 domain-containing protein [Flavobacteriales bacterium]